MRVLSATENDKYDLIATYYNQPTESNNRKAAMQGHVQSRHNLGCIEEGRENTNTQ